MVREANKLLESANHTVVQICDLCLCLPNENVLDRQSTGEGKSKHYKQISHGATLIFDDVSIFVLTSTCRDPSASPCSHGVRTIWRLISRSI